MDACRVAVAMSVMASIAAAGTVAAQPQQKYPTKPVRLVVTTTPGATPDILARLIGPKLGESWGQAVVIENRPGASGVIGATVVAKAAPDGYTLLLTSSAFAIRAALFPELPYDSLKDFSGVAEIGFGTPLLVASPAIGVKSVKELIAFAHARPGKILFGSAGAGTATHLAGERFRLVAGIKAQHVGFKGQQEFQLEIVAGRIHFGSTGVMPALQFIKEGRLVALAVGTPERSPLLPDVPTLAEIFPGYARLGTQSVLAPAGTPLPLRRQISREIARVLDLPDMRERLQAMAFYIQPSTPEEHDKNLRADIGVFSAIVRDAGLRPK